MIEIAAEMLKVHMPDLLLNIAQRRHSYILIAQRRIRPGAGSRLELLRARTWSKPVYPLNTLVSIPFVVIGGVATRLYAPERMTLDLDVLIAAEDADAFYQELEAAESPRLGPLAIPGSSWRLPDGTALDVLESEEPWTRAALSNPHIAPDGLPIVRLPYLTLLKLRSGRATDIADISRMLGDAIEDALYDVRAVVGRYEPEALEDLEAIITLGRLEYQERMK